MHGDGLKDQKKVRLMPELEFNSGQVLEKIWVESLFQGLFKLAFFPPAIEPNNDNDEDFLTYYPQINGSWNDNNHTVKQAFLLEKERLAPYMFSLVNGNGDTHNSLFELDGNGTLRTATNFDYESNASEYFVRVQARDDYNNKIEGNFTVTLIDLLEDMDDDGIEDSFDPDDDNDGFSDVDEIAYGSDPLDPNSLPNRTPTKIILVSNFVEENLLVGTVVGHLKRSMEMIRMVPVFINILFWLA